MAAFFRVVVGMAGVSFSFSGYINTVIRPCGPKLCTQLCESFSLCSSPEYDLTTLTCVLNYTKKGTESDRRIRSREGRVVSVHVGVQKTTSNQLKNHNGKKHGIQKKTAVERKKRKKINQIEDGDGLSLLQDVGRLNAICIGKGKYITYDIFQKKVSVGTFKLAEVKGIWFNGGRRTVCPQSTPDEIKARIANACTFGKNPGIRTDKDLIIWFHTGRLQNKACRMRFSICAYNSYEYLRPTNIPCSGFERVEARKPRRGRDRFKPFRRG